MRLRLFIAAALMLGAQPAAADEWEYDTWLYNTKSEELKWEMRFIEIAYDKARDASDFAEGCGHLREVIERSGKADGLFITVLGVLARRDLRDEHAKISRTREELRQQAALVQADFQRLCSSGQ